MRRRTYILAGLVLFGLFPPILSPTATYVHDSVDSLVFEIYLGKESPPFVYKRYQRLHTHNLR